ncbi:hypothetical protein GIB67_010750 [Kingdonia uniflora]|uniref:GHMP kinase N-terminal domain-containing protein n=1 Tax=Kingdonia uniflora TaxID=39325 RepID=A0A7J7L8Z5_9MAGN|nr:hypothetical protein GIB67_010750 [Kingdonia uniflora]
MQILGVRSMSLLILLKKGLPLGSRLGLSIMSVAATAAAINKMFGGVLSKSKLVLAGLESEARISGTGNNGWVCFDS